MELMTITEFIEELSKRGVKVSRQFIYDRIKNEEIEYKRISERKIYIYRKELERFTS